MAWLPHNSFRRKTKTAAREKSRVARCKRPGFAPTLEVLEDRLVLSTAVAAPSGTLGCLPVTVNFAEPTTPPIESVGITFNGSPVEFGVAGQFVTSVNGGPQFNALCVDLFHDVFPGETYMVLPISTATAQSSGLVPMNAGEIAYLNDTYNTTTLSAIQGAGLQVAIWELEYGNQFKLVEAGGGSDTTAVQNAANAYLAAGAGHSATATFYEPCAGTPTGQGLIGGPLTVTKTADQSTVTAGQPVGFTVTITNTGLVPATGVTLTDLLPAGAGNDITYTIDTSGTGLGKGTTPQYFQITGATGSQSLGLSSAFTTGQSDTLAPGQTISVHITGTTSAKDVTGVANPALGAAGNYAVLYEGTGGHNLQITNVTIDGSVGVGGTGHVQFNGPGTIGGELDFSAANTGQYSNNNGSDIGPSSVNYSDAAVTAALNTVNTLSSSLAGMGTSLTINGNQTINESAGQLDAVNGVNYRVFNVTSYQEGNGNLVTINGDGSGDTVVFNFGANQNVNLGGDVALTGGLTPDQVLWNFTSTNQNISLNNNASSYRNLAFQGVILAPNDGISVVNSNLLGRVFGGNSSDMQIVSGDTIKAPGLLNTVTVSAFEVSQQQATATATVLISPAAPQLALGSTSSAGAGLGELLGSSGLQTGTLGVAIDLPQGPQTAAELAAIRRAIASLDVQLAPLGIDLVEVSGAEAAAAPIQISMASTTAIGGVDQGVLGAFTGTGDITLVSGWNWYFGSAAGPIAANQYDFQTVVMHELGHALGLGESADPNSVMYLYLGQGQVQHGLTANDLSAIRQELGDSPTPLSASAASAVADPVLPTAVDAAEGLSPALPPVLESVVDSGLDLPGSVAGAIDTLALLEPLPASPSGDRLAEVNSGGTAPLSVLDLALQSFLQGSSSAPEVALTSSRGNEGAEWRGSRLLYVRAEDIRPASASDPLAGDAAVDWLFSVTQDDGTGLPASGQDSGLSSSGGDDSGASGYDA